VPDIARDYGLSEAAVEELGLSSHVLAGEDDHPSTLGARATRAALEAAGLGPEDLDLLIFAGVSRDWPAPWVAAFGVLHELGGTRAAGFDLASRCAGGIDALWLARSLIDNGTHRHVAVCCAERFDYLLGPPRPTELPSDAFYAAGAATAVVSAEAGNELVAFSSHTNPDLSLHATMGPRAGGSRLPVTAEAVERGEHQWQSQLSVRNVLEIARYSADADRINYPRLLAQAGFDGVDFVVSSPLDPAPQLEVLEELGVDPAHTLFTVPFLGHIGPADLFLILGVAVATGRRLGRRIVLSTRTPAYSNALALASRGDEPGIAVAGEGLDLELWRQPEAVGGPR
jgi:3-oxoacyl-[acyl-carrier-protein] synthase-3